MDTNNNLTKEIMVGINSAEKTPGYVNSNAEVVEIFKSVGLSISVAQKYLQLKGENPLANTPKGKKLIDLARVLSEKGILTQVNEILSRPE